MRRALAAMVMTLAASVAAAHPYHESQAEIDYRTGCKCLEITLRVKPEELEIALMRAGAARLPLEDARMRDPIQQYVLRRFVLLDAQQRALELRWIGMEVDALGAWMYLQSPALSLPVQLRNDVLLEEEAEQVNRVLFRAGERKQSLRFARGAPRLQWVGNEPAAPEPGAAR